TGSHSSARSHAVGGSAAGATCLAAAQGVPHLGWYQRWTGWRRRDGLARRAVRAHLLQEHLVSSKSPRRNVLCSFRDPFHRGVAGFSNRLVAVCTRTPHHDLSIGRSAVWSNAADAFRAPYCPGRSHRSFALDWPPLFSPRPSESPNGQT